MAVHNQVEPMNITIQQARSEYKDFFKIIPEFDGKADGLSGRAFLTICEKTRAFIPQYGEDYIVAILSLKCKGESLKRVIEARITTLDKLKQFLNLHFRTVKSVSAWFREFSDFTQKSTERVIDSIIESVKTFNQ